MKNWKMLVFIFILTLTGSGFPSFADDQSSPADPLPSYSIGYGLSAGTPGIVHFDLIFTGREHTEMDPGVMCSLSLALPQALRDDAGDSVSGNKPENGDATFLSAQFGVPFFVQKNESLFFAISPVCGFGYYDIYRDKNRKDKTGYWLYGGGAVDFRYKLFFAEAGLAYGPSSHYYTLRIADRFSLLFRVGIMGWF